MTYIFMHNYPNGPSEIVNTSAMSYLRRCFADWLDSELAAARRPAAREAKGRVLIKPFPSLSRIVGKLMASKLHQLTSKACQASQYLVKHGCAYHKQLLEQNKQYIQSPPTVEKCNELSKQLFYTRLASIPGRYESFWNELDYVKNLCKHRQELKVEQAGIAALFGLECFAWFCAGEIIGRGFTITGYYV